MRYNERMTAYRDIAGNSGQSGPSNKPAESGTAERSSEAEFIALVRDLWAVDQVRVIQF
jgi:hypothetical protein